MKKQQQLQIFKNILATEIDKLSQEDFKEVLEQDSHFSKVPTWYSNVDKAKDEDNLQTRQYTVL